jgi:hypothetical protein
MIVFFERNRNGISLSLTYRLAQVLFYLKVASDGCGQHVMDVELDISYEFIQIKSNYNAESSSKPIGSHRGFKRRVRQGVTMYDSV